MAVGEGDGEQEHPGECQEQMWGSCRHRNGKDNGFHTLLVPSLPFAHLQQGYVLYVHPHLLDVKTTRAMLGDGRGGLLES